MSNLLTAPARNKPAVPPPTATPRTANYPQPVGKRCSRCGSQGPFWRNLGLKDGLSYHCTSCQNEMSRRWRAANRARHLAEGQQPQRRAAVLAVTT